MTHIWDKTIHINENIARALVEAQHPITVNSIRLLDEGWDNSVYLINEELIFRFPHRDWGIFCLENEIAIVPHLAANLSFPISSPTWIGHPCELYPYPFAGYRLIPGLPLCEATTSLIHDKAFAIMLAKWLKELHGIKVTDEYTDFIKGDHSWRLNIERRVTRCEEHITKYEEYFLQAGFKKSLLMEIITFVKNLNLTERSQVYLHGDLYYRHIIVEPVSLLPSGLIDWGDVHVGDPGIDLAVGMIFSEGSLSVFMDQYGNIDQERFTLMLFHAFCHTMNSLPYAYEQNKTSLMQWAAIVLGRTIDEIKKGF